MAQPQVENGIAFLLLKCFIVEIVNFPREKKKTSDRGRGTKLYSKTCSLL